MTVSELVLNLDAFADAFTASMIYKSPKRNSKPHAKIVSVKLFSLFPGGLKKLVNGGCQEGKGSISILGNHLVNVSTHMLSISLTDLISVQNALVSNSSRTLLV